MRTKLIIFITMLSLGFSAQAQTKVTVQTFKDNPDLVGGIYHKYVYEPSEQPAVPAGYKPYFVEMISRHSSRYHTSPYRYVLVRQVLDEASEKGGLTPFGEDMRVVFDRIADEADGKDAAASEIGKEEQRGIAERMFRSNKKLFSTKGALVRNFSSDKPRCFITMSTFDLKLAQLNPSMRVYQESDAVAQKLLREQTGSKSIQKQAKAETLAEIRKVLDRIGDDVLARLFKPGGCPFMDDPDKKAEFVRSLSDLSIIHQGYADDRIDDMFTPEEKYALWEKVLPYRYLQYGASYKYGDAVMADGMVLIRELKKRAEDRIGGDEAIASLYFGHDYTVLSFIEAMQFDGKCVRTDDMEHLKDVWNDYELSPMSANVQLIFYRNRKDDVIVKLMLNEKVCTIPLESDMAPFYHWKDLSPYMQAQVDKIASYPAVKALDIDAKRPVEVPAFGTFYSNYGK